MLLKTVGGFVPERTQVNVGVTLEQLIGASYKQDAAASSHGVPALIDSQDTAPVGGTRRL